MPRPISSRAAVSILVVIALVSALAVMATGVFGRTVAPAPEPTKAPIVRPSAPPTIAPSPQPTVKPSTPAADGVFDVDLENLTDHDVSIVIEDETGTVVNAESGTPGDGMTVRWFDLKIENLDADTLRIVWVGLPRDEVVRLGVSTVDGQVRLRFVQASPPLNSDATGYDRILELSFDQLVRAEDVQASVQESLDTQD